MYIVTALFSQGAEQSSEVATKWAHSIVDQNLNDTNVVSSII